MSCFRENDRGSCCRRREGEVPFPLLPSDIDRITKKTQTPRDRFVEERKYTQAEVNLLTKQSVYWSYAFSVNNIAPVLRVNEDGVCRFLVDGVGCLLGPERPAMCRLYPFFLSDAEGEEKTITLAYGSDCPVARKCGMNPRAVMGALGQTEESLKAAAKEVVLSLYSGTPYRGS